MQTLLAEINADQMIDLAVNIVVVGVICWLVWWLVDFATVPAPFNKVVKVIVALFAVVWLARLLLNLT